MIRVFSLLLTLILFPSGFLSAEDKQGDWAKDGGQFLKQHCLRCHSGAKPKADLSLDTLTKSEELLQHRKAWDGVAQMIELGIMPPEDQPQPTLEEKQAFLKLLKQEFIAADRNAKPNPGRVTMRRLNRTEYRNTVRDLLGVDFDPTEDFPSDDLGYGFDNNGDVLTLPPVLMERYLAASERIVKRAITPTPPKSPKRNINARYTEPAGPNVSDGRYRLLTNDPNEKDHRRTGPVFTRYRIPAGEYIFRSKVYAESASKKPVKIAILAAGKELSGGTIATESQKAKLSGNGVEGLSPFVIVGTVEITATDPKKPEQIEVETTYLSGIERFAIAMFKLPENATDGKPDKVYLEHLALEGPLDTRPESHQKLFATPPNLSEQAQTEHILRRFVSRAYRRPATDAEVKRLIELVQSVQAEGGKWEEGIQFAVQAVLCSPKFLFRVELDSNPGSDEIKPLTDYQLASRLSYFLWSTMPDAELLALAEKNQLSANLEQQVRRMLADPKAQEGLVDNFALQWLQLERLRTHMPDPELFPKFDPKLRAAMLEETQLFLSEILREDLSLLTLIDADFTYVDQTLARHYGIEDTKGKLRGQKPVNGKGGPIPRKGFVRVELARQQRGGLLTQASILTVTSNPTRTSPVKRGRWVMEQLLGISPPPPPPNVPELQENDQAQLTGSLRQRMEQHRKNPSCASCHKMMDPLGFAFENYDAIGGFRLKDGNFDIDPAGTLPDGNSFEGPTELKQILTEKKSEITRNLTEKLLIWALGRGLEYYDQRAVDEIVKKLETDNDRFSTLILEIVKSQPFRMRRGG